MTTKSRIAIAVLLTAVPIAIVFVIFNLWMLDDESLTGRVFLNGFLFFFFALGIGIGIRRILKKNE